MKKEIDERLIPIMAKMCEYVGADPDEIEWKNEDDPYYMKHEWTPEQEQAFIDWFADYMYENKEVRDAIMAFPRKTKKYCREVSEQFVYCHGWSTLR